uniref:PLAT domain-containing protein n=2 Tax=Macrostomum lignano TaxID=282301 RepID=A0A1I8FHX9_9PLAT
VISAPRAPGQCGNKEVPICPGVKQETVAPWQSMSAGIEAKPAASCRITEVNRKYLLDYCSLNSTESASSSSGPSRSESPGIDQVGVIRCRQPDMRPCRTRRSRTSGRNNNKSNCNKTNNRTNSKSKTNRNNSKTNNNNNNSSNKTNSNNKTTATTRQTTATTRQTAATDKQQQQDKQNSNSTRQQAARTSKQQQDKQQNKTNTANNSNKQQDKQQQQENKQQHNKTSKQQDNKQQQAATATTRQTATTRRTAKTRQTAQQQLDESMPSVHISIQQKPPAAQSLSGRPHFAGCLWLPVSGQKFAKFSISDGESTELSDDDQEFEEAIAAALAVLQLDGAEAEPGDDAQDGAPETGRLEHPEGAAYKLRFVTATAGVEPATTTDGQSETGTSWPGSVRVNLVGERGQSGEMGFECSEHGARLAPGSTVEFPLSIPELGRLLRLRVRIPEENFRPAQAADDGIEKEASDAASSGSWILDRADAAAVQLQGALVGGSEGHPSAGLVLASVIVAQVVLAGAVHVVPLALHSQKSDSPPDVSTETRWPGWRMLPSASTQPVWLPRGGCAEEAHLVAAGGGGSADPAQSPAGCPASAWRCSLTLASTDLRSSSKRQRSQDSQRGRPGRSRRLHSGWAAIRQFGTMRPFVHALGGDKGWQQADEQHEQRLAGMAGIWDSDSGSGTKRKMKLRYLKAKRLRIYPS